MLKKKKNKTKRRRRKCHVKHFTSRNKRQIVDRSMNPWPHTQTTCQDWWNTIRLRPIGKVFRARLLGTRGEYNICLVHGSFSHCFSSFNLVSWWSFRIQCLIYEVWPTIAVTVYLFSNRKISETDKQIDNYISYGLNKKSWTDQLLWYFPLLLEHLQWRL